MNRVVQKLQFMNNLLVKIAFLQGFSPKKCRNCEGTNRVPEQVQYSGFETMIPDRAHRGNMKEEN